MTRAEADPPYFSITPDSARADLGPPVGTAGFAEVARKAAQGRAEAIQTPVPIARPDFGRAISHNHIPQG